LQTLTSAYESEILILREPDFGGMAGTGGIRLKKKLPIKNNINGKFNMTSNQSLKLHERTASKS